MPKNKIDHGLVLNRARRVERERPKIRGHGGRHRSEDGRGYDVYLLPYEHSSAEEIERRIQEGMNRMKGTSRR